MKTSKDTQALKKLYKKTQSLTLEIKQKGILKVFYGRRKRRKRGWRVWVGEEKTENK